MTNTQILAAAAVAVVLAGQVHAQASQKPISRSDYIKVVDSHFNSVDTNHDGKITKEELAAEAQRELEQAKARVAQEMEAKFRQLDTNKDGQLSLQEFMAAAPPVRAIETPDQIIRKLDTDHDGTISAEEFRAPELAKFNRVDTNHDGIVTPEEIKAANGRK